MIKDVLSKDIKELLPTKPIEEVIAEGELPESRVKQFENMFTRLKRKYTQKEAITQVCHDIMLNMLQNLSYGKLTIPIAISLLKDYINEQEPGSSAQPMVNHEAVDVEMITRNLYEELGRKGITVQWIRPSFVIKHEGVTFDVKPK